MSSGMRGARGRSGRGSADRAGLAPSLGRDAGPPFDGGPPLDGGLPFDGGPPLDGGLPFDAAPPFEGGPPLDGGLPFDAAPPFPGGLPFDGGFRSRGPDDDVMGCILADQGCRAAGRVTGPQSRTTAITAMRPGTAHNTCEKGRIRRCDPFRKMSGGVLLSHAVTRAVPSALRGLASGFGMEPGVSLSLWPPKHYGVINRVPDRSSGTAQWTQIRKVERKKGQVLGLLVPVSCTHCCASTSGLSTQCSRWGPYQVNPVGVLILERASRLDAFSGYLFRT